MPYGIQQPLLAGIPERLERQVRIDGVGAVTDQEAVMVNLARLPVSSTMPIRVRFARRTR